MCYRDFDKCEKYTVSGDLMITLQIHACQFVDRIQLVSTSWNSFVRGHVKILSNIAIMKRLSMYEKRMIKTWLFFSSLIHILKWFTLMWDLFLHCTQSAWISSTHLFSTFILAKQMWSEILCDEFYFFIGRRFTASQIPCCKANGPK